MLLAPVACGGATASSEVDSGAGDTGVADAAAAHDAWTDSPAARDGSSPPVDASDDGAAKIAACDACLQTHCASSYATCTASATCVTQLNDTILCKPTAQDAIPGELVLCYGQCAACLCHP